MRGKHKDQPMLESKNLTLYPLLPEQMQLFKNDPAAENYKNRIMSVEHEQQIFEI